MQLTGKGITFTWKDKKSGSSATFSKEKNEEIYKKLSGKTAVVAEVKKTKKTSQPEGLYDLTDLSRDANQRFGFSAKQTLNIMQSLYEHHKVLTYPRTDSRNRRGRDIKRTCGGDCGRPVQKLHKYSVKRKNHTEKVFCK